MLFRQVLYNVSVSFWSCALILLLKKAKTISGEPMYFQKACKDMLMKTATLTNNAFNVVQQCTAGGGASHLATEYTVSFSARSTCSLTWTTAFVHGCQLKQDSEVCVISVKCCDPVVST